MQKPSNATLPFCLDNMVKSVWGDGTVGLLTTGEPHSLVFLNELMSKKKKKKRVHSEGHKKKSPQRRALCSSLFFLCNIVINDLRLLTNLQCFQADGNNR